MTAPVVVGVDDMDQSPHSLSLATHEAELRGTPLWIVHAYHRVPLEAAVRDPDVEPVAQAVKQTRAEHPELEVHGYAVGTPVAQGLATMAADAALLVLGHRGRGGFAGMMLGSVALRTAAHARCPVAVARGARRSVNRMVVGLDITDASADQAILGFAFEEAALRGAELIVLHVWQDPGYFYPDPMGDYTRDHLVALDTDHRGRLETILRPWRGEHPEVSVGVVVEGGSASRGLVDASGHADLLVIGGRPRHEGEGMRLGALAYSLLHHAQCPVVIVPER